MGQFRVSFGEVTSEFKIIISFVFDAQAWRSECEICPDQLRKLREEI